MATNRPPFDPAVAEGLRELLQVWPAEITPNGIDEVRRVTQAYFPTVDDYLGVRDLEHRDITVPGPSGAPEITLAVYTPRTAGPQAPCLYFVHSGGMISGTRFSEEVGLLDMAVAFGAVGVSVEYRLAPENPYPAPVEDCYAGLCAVEANAGALGIDPLRIVLIGESAGGGLAAATALLARDRSGPRILAQLLATPMLDDRCDSPSSIQMDGVGCWDMESNRTGWRALLGDAQGGSEVPYTAAPARADDLIGLPPTFLEVGSAEIFRSECVAFAERLWLSGVDAEFHVWPGACHTHYALAPDAAVSRRTRTARMTWLADILKGTR